MTLQERATRGWALALVGATGIVLGIGATLWWTSRRTASSTRVPQAAPASTTLASPVTISLALDVLARAGIRTEVVQTRSMAMHVHMPGRVEPNVVQADDHSSGDARPHQRLAPRNSARGSRRGKSSASSMPRSCRAGALLLAMRAELEAAHARLLRTEELVALGLVSQQELETAAPSMSGMRPTSRARAPRLSLLGLSANQIAQLTQPLEISAFIDIVSPQSGVS